jgi:hypothetical protein
VTRSRLYVARGDQVTVVSRRRLRLSGSRPVHRAWPQLAETTWGADDAAPRRSLLDAAVVLVPPVAALGVTTAFAPVESGFLVGGVVLFATSYLAPVLRRRRMAKGPRVSRGDDIRMLTAERERADFARAIGIADRISETWPQLGPLVDARDAGQLLAEALWEIAGVLVRRQELSGVVGELSRPDFTAGMEADDTTRELREHLRAGKAALGELEVDLARREASLRRAEQAGRDFIREQEMRRAIRAAEESLRTVRRPEIRGAAVTPADAGAELAEHTQSVLTAYRELTAGLHPTDAA